MKKLGSLLSVLAVIISLSLFTACGGKDGATAEGGKTEEGAASSSVVGKWQVVDMAIDGMTKEEEAMMGMMKAAIVGENMTFEFTSDGVAKTASKSLPASEGKYEQSGMALKVKDAKSGKEETMDIVKLTSDSLFVNMTLEGKKMTMKMKKQ